MIKTGFITLVNPLMSDYKDHFHRIMINSRCSSNACYSYSVHHASKVRVSSFVTPPCIMTYIDGMLQIESEDGSVEDAYGMAEYKLILKSGLNGICSTTWLVLRLFTILFGRSEGTGKDQKHHDR